MYLEQQRLILLSQDCCVLYKTEIVKLRADHPRECYTDKLSTCFEETDENGSLADNVEL